MPALAAVPWLIPALTAASAATSIGLGIDEAVKSGGGGTAGGQTPAQIAQAQQLAQQKAAFLSSEAQGSTPAAGGAPGATSNAPSPEQLQAMLKLLNPTGVQGGTSNVNISGGFSGSTTPPPQVTNGLTSLSI